MRITSLRASATSSSGSLAKTSCSNAIEPREGAPGSLIRQLFVVMPGRDLEAAGLLLECETRRTTSRLSAALEKSEGPLRSIRSRPTACRQISSNDFIAPVTSANIRSFADPLPSMAHVVWCPKAVPTCEQDGPGPAGGTYICMGRALRHGRSPAHQLRVLFAGPEFHDAQSPTATTAVMSATLKLAAGNEVTRPAGAGPA